MLSTPFSPIAELLADLRAGKMVIILDANDRENEGDLIAPATTITPEQIMFMATYGRGLICVALESARLDALKIPLLQESEGRFRTAWAISVDARRATTGISAFERADTIQLLTDEATQAHDLVRPGHIFPLRADPGGILTRPGHTEAAVDLMKLAGLYPAGVLCEIIRDDGQMARADELQSFARKHNLKLGSIAELIVYRRQNL